MQQLISIIVPVYNEAPNIPVLHDEIVKHISGLPYDFEFVFVDDGSRDNSARVIQKLARRKQRRRIRLIELSRNFGKEAAVSAGLHAAKGDAAIILDADLQHPPNIIHKFINKWRRGAEVVVGVKHYGKADSWFKRFSSDMFYRLLQPISDSEITPHAADYRLLDRRVIDAFSNLSEHNRINRGLIDWLGFRRDYVQFEVSPRRFGTRQYSFRKLTTLAMNSFTAYSLVPLKLASYLGNFILLAAGLLGLFLAVEKYLLGDPLHLLVTTTGLLALMIVFLIGIVLECLGMVALYIAHIHAEVTNRPLYVVRNQVEAVRPGSEKVIEPAEPITTPAAEPVPLAIANPTTPLETEPAAEEVRL
jgi:polyisoprenyl-phosphate glycosyltransferase